MPSGNQRQNVHCFIIGTFFSLMYPLPGDMMRTMSKLQIHETHSEIVKRLKRAEGHLRTILAMIESRRPCLDIAQQLHAVEKALGAAKKALIHDHIDHCLEQAVGPASREARAPIEEFKEITKYL